MIKVVINNSCNAGFQTPLYRSDGRSRARHNYQSKHQLKNWGRRGDKFTRKQFLTRRCGYAGIYRNRHTQCTRKRSISLLNNNMVAS